MTLSSVASFVRLYTKLKGQPSYRTDFLILIIWQQKDIYIDHDIWFDIICETMQTSLPTLIRRKLVHEYQFDFKKRHATSEEIHRIINEISQNIYRKLQKSQGLLGTLKTKLILLQFQKCTALHTQSVLEYFKKILQHQCCIYYRLQIYPTTNLFLSYSISVASRNS